MKRDTSNIAILLILSLLVLGLLITTFLGLRKHEAAKTEIAQLRAKAIEDQRASQGEQERLLAELDGNWKRTLAENDEDWEEKLANQQAEQQKRLALAFERFDQLLNDSGQALSYISDLESRLGTAQTLSEAELGELGTLAQSLQYLRAQYRKPLEDFDSMAGYLEARASEAVAVPNAKMSGFKRVFSKKFREEEKAYLKSVASREAYLDMNNRFKTAYWRAQRSMDEAAADLDGQIASIQKLIASKERNAAQIGAFINTSKDIIRIHQGIIDFDPVTEEIPTPQPLSP